MRALLGWLLSPISRAIERVGDAMDVIWLDDEESD